MGIDPGDFEDHAKRVADEYEDEVAFRSAISRGYYYAYLFVKSQGEGHYGITFNGDSKDHQKAVRVARKAGGSELKKDLRELRKKRNKADYDIEDDIEEMDWAMFKHEVEEFILDFKSNI